MIRTGDAVKLPGTRIQNRCPVVSVGLDAIDSLMGGGLPLSNIYVISESNSKKYAPILQRYFVAEGLNNKHSVFVYGPALNFEELIENIPSCSSDAEKGKEEQVCQSKYEIVFHTFRLQSDLKKRCRLHGAIKRCRS
jgi:archaellum biogenesis ATPase FlaH